MATKLDYGPGDLHILSSNGPPSDNLHFYSTTYSSRFKGSGVGGNQDWKTLARLNLRHKGTGYTANFRPAIYYSPDQDAVDNPPMRQLLKDNYLTNTKRDYIKHRCPDPNEPLPTKVISGLSGFGQNTNPTLPTQREIREVFADTRYGGALPVYPRHRPLLQSINDRDPVSKENAAHGPKAMSTECHTRFAGDRPAEKQRSANAVIEDSGFTQAYNVEPVTFRPFENHGGELPGYMTWRPTGYSIMKRDFNPTQVLTGNEPLQSLSDRADMSTGYVKGNDADSTVLPSNNNKFGYTVESEAHPTIRQKIRKDDPAEYSNMTRPYQYTTMQGHNFLGKQRPSISEARFWGREGLGPKEGTGYTGNNAPMVELASERDPNRFSTNYQHKHPDPTPTGAARYGHVANGGGVQQALGNSFTLNTKLHQLGPPLDTGKQLRNMNPYAARSLTSRHPYYNDGTHSHKTRPTLMGTV